jgi:FAD/FMN-containing dehydrogenase
MRNCGISGCAVAEKPFKYRNVFLTTPIKARGREQIKMGTLLEEISMKEFSKDQISVLAGFVDSQRFSTGQSNRELHLHDISAHRGSMPAGIIWPVTTEEVSHVLAWAYAQDVPVTPWGAGTSTEGNPVPTRGGLAIDMTRAVEISGTYTGEHGIGKRKFMELEHGQSYQLMRQIKDLIDPKGLLNPGKIFL